jgi:adenylyltransferase/sulfurtransferase
MNHELSPEEILRYSRQLIIPEIGIKGQIKLKESSILIVGCGGLGSPLALYLSAAGIGRIGIVDHDTLDISNLHRQVIYSIEDIGKPKVESARKRMLAINPEIQVDAYNELFTSQNARRIAKPYQIIIDGTDNIPTRYLINDLCVFTKKPYIYGAVYRFFGQVSVFDSSIGPCYRCIFPTPPLPESVPSCAVAGVVGVLPGIIGQIQATEAIKFIFGIGTPLINQLMLYDALENTTTKIKISKNPDCIVCGKRPEIFDLIDYEKFCKLSIRGNDLIGGDAQSISPIELSKKIKNGEEIRIIDLREPVELEISAILKSINVPFIKLTEEMKNWKKSQPIVLVCHIGFLSAIAQRMLAEDGFKNVKSLKGGIRAWATEVDPSVRIY